MTGEQGDLFDLPNPGDPGQEVRDTCALIAGDSRHATDRERIVEAILGDAGANGGHVDPNRVRQRLTHRLGGLDVNPRVVGPVYAALTGVGVLRFRKWVTSEDTVGRNRGKPARAYTLIRGEVAA